MPRSRWHGNTADVLWQRDESLRAIRCSRRKRWKHESGSHRRSLAETAFLRLKTIFDPTLHSREWSLQTTELILRVATLNRMRHLGMPESYLLAAVQRERNETTFLVIDSCNKALKPINHFHYFLSIAFKI